MACRAESYEREASNREDFRYNYDQMDTSVSTSGLSGDDLARFVIRRLCKSNGKETLKNIISKNYQLLELASIQTTSQLRDLLQQYSHCFILRQQSSDTDEPETATSRQGGQRNEK
ncbi:hypothetical protein BaRGS_00036415 [Batillaria attramentaria]|uniref:Uncharacterized protein n=1 Tax=Batillaria attramentaria TaxID=370345 RepID=A0ABD0JD57_9CAEN